MNSQNYMVGTDMYQRHMDIGSSLVLGNQWGDEGKGKVVDIMTQLSDVVIRFQGGHNAGHTVKIGNMEFDLHILPSGVVSEGKINLITSGCVLGIDLNKIDLEQIKINQFGVYCDSKFEQLIKKKNGEDIRVGLIPEIEKLKAKGIDFKKSGLKISGETKVIGMHNVILDGYDEKCRKYAGLEPIGSTGSGISRSYASESQRLHFTLNDLLKRPDDYYDSIKALWAPYAYNFPLINEYDLIEHAKKERQAIIEMLQNGELEIIDNEQEYIADLSNSGKKIVGEGAQAAMIGSGNSYFGTASNPSFEEFSRVTGLTASQVGNIFLVHKMPPSSVGYRPQYLKFENTREVEGFIDKYGEIGVSTGRRRDLFNFSGNETAKGAFLNSKGIGDQSKIVPVFNRVDGLRDALGFYPDGLFKMVGGFTYRVKNILTGEPENVRVGIMPGEDITPVGLLRNYPEKSDQLDLFSVTPDDLYMIDVADSKATFNRQVNRLLGMHLGAIFDTNNNGPKDIIVGTGPGRDQMELRSIEPTRR